MYFSYIPNNFADAQTRPLLTIEGLIHCLSYIPIIHYGTSGMVTLRNVFLLVHNICCLSTPAGGSHGSGPLGILMGVSKYRYEWLYYKCVYV